MHQIHSDNFARLLEELALGLEHYVDTIRHQVLAGASNLYAAIHQLLLRIEWKDAQVRAHDLHEVDDRSRPSVQLITEKPNYGRLRTNTRRRDY